MTFEEILARVQKLLSQESNRFELHYRSYFLDTADPCENVHVDIGKCNLQSWKDFVGTFYIPLFPTDLPNEEPVVTKPVSLECPCGIHRADCEYHR